MGKIRAQQAYFLDLASEEVACSTGVLLTDKNLATISKRYGIDELSDLDRGNGETIIRPEDFEDAILNIRVAIGNLPDAKMGQFVLMDVCKAIDERGGDALKINDAYHRVADSGKYRTLTDEAIDEIAVISGQRRDHVIRFALGWDEMKRREVHFLYRRARQKPWDGVLKLDQLFHGEHIPDDPEVYLDQRYIDYLAKMSSIV
jgi:hypothetical protein